MVSPIANIDSDLAKNGVEDGMARISFHVIRRLIKVAHSGDVVLTMLSHIMAVLIDDHRCVPDGVLVIIAFKDRAYQHHTMLPSQLRDEMETLASLRTFRQLHPRLFLSGAEEKKAPSSTPGDTARSCPPLQQSPQLLRSASRWRRVVR
mmetsp:Transcript_7047/g.9783  ORF Transcript_7047/g.9783 Transcript_7047/m.9783 type:complete len:149 (-) Transcript_7047:432-878(-)